MEQDDGAGMNPAQKFVKGFFRGGLVILIPVHICQTPEKGLISELLCHLQIFFVVFSLRGTVEFRHFLSGHIAIGVFYIYKFFFEGIHGCNLGHIRVVPGVVSHSVTFFHHSFYQFRFRIYVCSNYKKCGGYAVLCKRVQNGLCVSVFIACVEGEIEHFLVSVFRIVGVILCQFVERGVPHGRLSLLLKAQSPVSFR